MGAKAKYPWYAWFERPRVEIVRGVDYTCSQSSMAQTIRNNASMRKLRVSIQDTGNGFIITNPGIKESDDNIRNPG